MLATFTKTILPIAFVSGLLGVGLVNAYYGNENYLSDHPFLKELSQKVSKQSLHFKNEKVYMQLDKTLFKPGEDIWFKLYVRNAQNFQETSQSGVVYAEFINPKGSVEKTLTLQVQQGGAVGEFALPQDIKGGLYKIKAYTQWQKNTDAFIEREILVQKVVLPNLNMKLEFDRKAHGPGDKVTARLDLNTLDKQPLRNQAFDMVVSLDGEKMDVVKGSTNELGQAYLEFDLPKDLKTNDGLFNIMFPYKGQTESISRSIPIVLGNIDLQFFPEGGAFIEGMPNTVAFKALNEFGQPADISGEIVDSKGQKVADFSSYHQGMGAVAFIPSSSKKYQAKITQPASCKQVFDLPNATKKGHSLRLKDQNESVVTVEILSAQTEKIFLVAQHHEEIVFSKDLEVQAGVTSVEIPTDAFSIGIAQLTIFNSNKVPQAERLVFMNKDQQLDIQISTDKDKYLPREQVNMEIQVRDHSGKPVQGDFSLAVVDDKLLSFANDKQGHILSYMLLESDLKGDIVEPNFYFDDENDPNREKTHIDRSTALNHLLMTQGWRSFAWEAVQKEEFTALAYSAEMPVIAGQVKDRQGKPVAGAVVEALDENLRTVTDKNGQYVLEQVALDESITLRVGATGFNTMAYQITDYTHSYDVVLNKDRIVSGVVLDSKTQKPLAGAYVWVPNYGGYAYSDKDGNFQIYMPEQYTEFMINHGGDVYEYRTITLPKENKPITIDLMTLEQAERDAPKRWKESVCYYLGYNPDDISDSDLRAEYDIYRIRMDKHSDNVSITTLSSGGGRKKGGRRKAARIEIEDALFEADMALGDAIPEEPMMIAEFVEEPIEEDDNRVPPSPPPPPPAPDNQPGVNKQNLEVDKEENAMGEEVIADFDEIMFEEIADKEAFMDGGGFALNAKKKKDVAFQPVQNVVTQMPVFIAESCEGMRKRPTSFVICTNEKLLEAVYNELEYPKGAQDNKIGGEVVAQFTINQYGMVTAPYLVKNPGQGMGNAVLEALQKLPAFEPARMNGQPVSVIYEVPIKFSAGITPKDMAKKVSTLAQPKTLAQSTFARSETRYYKARQFYAPKYEQKKAITARTDFRSTVYWNPSVKTDENGKANIVFYNSDAISQFKVTLEGFGMGGSLGRSTHTFFTQMPFEMLTKVPAEVLTGDVVGIPLTLTNNTDKSISGDLILVEPANFKPLQKIDLAITVQPKESKTLFLNYQVLDTSLVGMFKIGFKAGVFSDITTTKIESSPRGFPVNEVFAGDQSTQTFNIIIQESLANSVEAKLKVYPSVLDEVMGGIESMLRMPGGCFEQTSSSNYPNLLALSYLRETNTSNPELENTAQGYLKTGYGRLTGYESPSGGFHWWGYDPGHEALTAYGLMQFVDMKAVYPVDQKMIDRTAKWLLGRKDGKGGWQKNSNALHSWAKSEVTDAYIVWALTEAGYAKDIKVELEKSYKDAVKSEDPYMMALLVNAYWYTDPKKAETLMKEILRMQKEDGSFEGLTSSVVNSTGQSLKVETSSLVALGMMKMDNYKTQLAKTIQFVQKGKGYYGYGSTQGTVLALKALLEYAKTSKKTASDGVLAVYVDQKKVTELVYKVGDKDIEITNFAQYLADGKQRVEVRYEQTNEPMPFDIELTYTTRLPKNSKECVLDLATTIAKNNAKMGETVRLKTTLKNKTNKGQPMTMAMVGIPAGLSLQPWQLKELQEKKVFDYYEIFDGYAVFHYEQMKPNEVREIALDLKADIPGIYEAPASSAFLYYTNEHRVWSMPEKVEIKNMSK